MALSPEVVLIRAYFYNGARCRVSCLLSKAPHDSQQMTKPWENESDTFSKTCNVLLGLSISI
jgi:hypothetical protein